MRMLLDRIEPDGLLVLTIPFGETEVTPVQRMYDRDDLDVLLEGWVIDTIDGGGAGRAGMGRCRRDPGHLPRRPIHPSHARSRSSPPTRMSDPCRIAIDLQPIQGYSSRGRGIGRYVLEQTKALVATYPDRVHSLLVNPHRGLSSEVEVFLGYRPRSCAHRPEAPVVDGCRRTPTTSRRRSSST